MPTYYREYPLLESQLREFVSELNVLLARAGEGSWQNNFTGDASKITSDMKIRFTRLPKISYFANSQLDSSFNPIVVLPDIISVTGEKVEIFPADYENLTPLLRKYQYILEKKGILRRKLVQTIL